MFLRLGYESVLVDVDGTLIDSNDAHAAAWTRALRERGLRVDFAQVRPLIGMGGDKLLPAIAGLDEASADGRAIAQRKRVFFEDLLPGLQATPGARALLQFLRGQGIDVVVATSAAEDEMGALLKQAGLDGLIETHASRSDASESKPDPDIVCAALAKARAGRASAVMIGDTPYDIEAAARAGVDAIALRCGGHWLDRELRGALHIFDDPQELLERWQQWVAASGERSTQYGTQPSSG